MNPARPSNLVLALTLTVTPMVPSEMANAYDAPPQ